MGDEILVRARALTRAYAGQTAVAGVSFELRRGEVLGFLGPNGAGKSTTLRMLTGNLAPTGGEIHLGSHALQEEPVAAKSTIGYLPEQPPLTPELTVQEYLRYAARLRRVPAAKVDDAVTLACTRCGLQSHRRRLIRQLSKGFQQRIGIAQAIVHDPAVVILDEPTVGLDPNQIREIRTLIRSLGEQHGVILSSHLLGEIQAVCTHVLIIHEGRPVFSADLADIETTHGESAVLVDLAAPPPAEDLRRLDGISEVETLGDGRFRLRHESGHSPAEALVETACARGWRLTSIRTETRSLEQVFVELTVTREAGAT